MLLQDGRIAVVMTPREAVHVYDNVLDPDDYPWKTTEALDTTERFRVALKAQILENTENMLAGIAALPETEEQPEEVAQG